MLSLIKRLTDIGNINCDIQNRSKCIIKFQDIDYINTLKTYLHYALTGNINKINMILMNNIQYHIMLNNSVIISKIVLEVLDEYTMNIQKEINQELMNNTFTITNFIKKYIKYGYYTNVLKNVLHRYESNICFKHIDIVTLRNYAFYKNVINQEYNISSIKTLHLYKIFNDILEKQNNTVNDILPLYRMHEFYCKFMNLLSKDANTHEFLNTLGSNKTFITNLLKQLNNNIKLISNKLNNTNKLCENVSNIITLAMSFNEKFVFCKLYQLYLEDRLLYTEYDESVELSFIKQFKLPDANEYVIKMLSMIKNINDDRLDNKINIGIKFESSKYTSLTQNQLDFDMVNIVPLQYGMWSIAETVDVVNYKVPIEVAPYVDLKTAFYKLKYPNIKLDWNYDIGNAIIELPINDRIYTIKVTCPQLFVLLQFNKKEKISIKEISENIGLSLAKTSKIISALCYTKLLLHEDRDKSDPNIKIYYNTNFTHKNTNLSFVNIHKKNVANKQIMEKLDKGLIKWRVELIAAAIVRVMKKHKSVFRKIMIKLVAKEILFKLNSKMFKIAFAKCIKDKYIKETDNTNEHGPEYVYCVN